MTLCITQTWYYVSHRNDTMHHTDMILCITQIWYYVPHRHDIMYYTAIILCITKTWYYVSSWRKLATQVHPFLCTLIKGKEKSWEMRIINLIIIDGLLNAILSTCAFIPTALYKMNVLFSFIQRNCMTWKECNPDKLWGRGRGAFSCEIESNRQQKIRCRLFFI